MNCHKVKGGGQVELAVFDAGDRAKQAIILIHGWSQHHLSWQRQFHSDLTANFHLVAPDLRGHGASDKPAGADHYDHSRPWAEDIAAIIDHFELEAPVLVGWSMGGWVVCDYLRVFGQDRLGGVVVIGSGIRMDPSLTALRSADVVAEATYGQDQAAEIAAVKAFVRACSHQPIDTESFASMVAFNMLCPPHIRSACRKRIEDYREVLGALTVPNMIVHGLQERVCIAPIYQELRAAMPAAQVHEYADCGHMPFWEDADRFNHDLQAFANYVWEQRQ